MDIMAAMPVASATFVLQFGQEVSGQGSGRTIAKNLRPPLWRATVMSTPLDADEANQVEALFDALQGTMGTFYAWNPKAPYPASDPEGRVVGTSAVKIKAIEESALLISLKGLPVGYILTRGDMLAFDFGSSPVHRALHRINAASVVADGSGETALFAVWPPLRTGAAADIVVNLKQAAAEMIILPGTFTAPTSGPTTQISFDALQVA